MRIPFVLPDPEIGIIAKWSGSIVNIPDGWLLCDGNNSTPDLRNKFIAGAGDSYSVNDTGGNAQHNHPFTGDGHFHTGQLGTDIDSVGGSNYVTNFDIEPTIGTTNNTANLPTYYALAFIMYVGT